MGNMGSVSNSRSKPASGSHGGRFHRLIGKNPNYLRNSVAIPPSDVCNDPGSGDIKQTEMQYNYNKKYSRRKHPVPLTGTSAASSHVPTNMKRGVKATDDDEGGVFSVIRREVPTIRLFNRIFRFL